MKRWTVDDQPLAGNLINAGDRLEKGTIGRTAQLVDDPDHPTILLLTPLSLAADTWNAIATAPACGRLFRISAHARGQAVTEYEDDWKVHGAGESVDIIDAEYDYGAEYHGSAGAASWFESILDDRRWEPTAYRDEFGHDKGDRFYLYEPFAPARATAKVRIVESEQ